MYKFKQFSLSVLTVLLFASTAFAGGIGYIDYQKIQDNYSFAQSAIKEVENKGLALQQYLVDKEKEYKSLDTPLKKKSFEQKITTDFKAKEDAYIKFKLKKEEEVYNKIQAAAKSVMVEQKLDAILDYRVIFVGGIDVSDLVIEKLKGGK